MMQVDVSAKMPLIEKLILIVAISAKSKVMFWKKVLDEIIEFFHCQENIESPIYYSHISWIKKGIVVFSEKQRVNQKIYINKIYKINSKK